MIFKKFGGLLLVSLLAISSLSVFRSAAPAANHSKKHQAPAVDTPPASYTLDLHGVELPEGHFFNVYTDKRPITPGNFQLAKRLAARRPATESRFTHHATYSGDHYFLVTTCDKWGRETVEFGKDGALGPVRLADRIPPAPIPLKLRHVGKNIVLTWNIPHLKNPEGIETYRIYRGTSPKNLVREDALLSTVARPLFDISVSYTTTNPVGKNDIIFYYAITAVDKAGNQSGPSNIERSADRPDLAIASADHIRDNPDLAISKLYPVKGQAVTFNARIRNSGLRPAERVACRTRLIDDEGNLVAERKVQIDRIKAESHYDFPFTFNPAQTGPHRVDVELDYPSSVLEISETNNTSSLTIHVVDRDYFFVWYGDPKHLKHINVTQTAQFAIAEWNRRGVTAGAWAGVGGKDPRSAYFRKPELGYNAAIVDEIGALGDKAKELLAILPDLKKSHPDFVVAIWLAAGIPEEIAELTKQGVIDLLMLEIYINCGSLKYEERLSKAIENARKAGVLHRTVIGLGSAAGYANYASPHAHAEFLEKQIQFIRKEAPEMPGLAFFSASTLPGVDVKLDEMCFKYFIQSYEQ